MQTSTKGVYLSNIGIHLTIEIPQTCPNCGIGNNPTSSEISNIDIKHGKAIGVFHLCPSCKKGHMTIQERLNGENKTSMTLVYPNKVVADIDPLLIEHAPNFVEVYSEAIQAEKYGLEHIAGMGYRLAIESLIKDYAQNFELATPEEIAKLNFNNAIDKFMKEDELLKNSIHTVRKIGNDYSHWKKEYDLPLHALKAYVDIVIQSFKIKFMMKYPPV